MSNTYKLAARSNDGLIAEYEFTEKIATDPTMLAALVQEADSRIKALRQYHRNQGKGQARQ